MEQEIKAPITATPEASAPAQEGTPPIVPAPDPLKEKEEQLNRLEKTLKAQAKAFHRQKKEWEKQKSVPATPQETRAQALDMSQVKAQFLKDPLSLGITPDELQQATFQTLNEITPESQTIKQLQAEIEKLKAQVDGTKSTLEQSQNTAYQQAIKQYERDTTRLVEAHPEKYELIGKDYVKDVVSFIELTFKEDGILLSVEDAADQVENFLLEKSLTMARSKKVQSKLAPPPAPKEETKEEPQGTRTLSHSMAPGSRPLSARDRAILAFKGQKAS